MLRRQSQNSQLTARGFFQAAARVSLKHDALLNREKPTVCVGEKPLTSEELLVENAL
jgi:hypothetical protein